MAIDNWDTISLNWTNAGAPAAYNEGNQVLFNDMARTGTVNLTGTAQHAPLSWTVTNNALNYIFAGSNSVGGTAALVKSGAGSATLSESNDDFIGGIVVNGGTLILDESDSAISGSPSGWHLSRKANKRISTHIRQPRSCSLCTPHKKLPISPLPQMHCAEQQMRCADPGT
ncbi:MAG TPA: hypothetical protein VGY56_07450 [Verrucomicrobiae bacterium]|nr:hypothetical protein [Verrucomicrobiae bacterium]